MINNCWQKSEGKDIFSPWDTPWLCCDPGELLQNWAWSPVGVPRSSREHPEPVCPQGRWGWAGKLSGPRRVTPWGTQGRCSRHVAELIRLAGTQLPSFSLWVHNKGRNIHSGRTLLVLQILFQQKRERIMQGKHFPLSFYSKYYAWGREICKNNRKL